MEIKIPFYNILNMFLTGLVFFGGCAVVFPMDTLNLLKNEIITSIGTGPEIVFTVCAFAAAYEIGLIINRIGSVIIEPVLKKVKLIPFDNDYVKYNKKKKEYPIMDILSREFALSRTGIALFVILSVLAVCAHAWIWSIVFALVGIVYFFSCKKHAQKIVNLING